MQTPVGLLTRSVNKFGQEKESQNNSPWVEVFSLGLTLESLGPNRTEISQSRSAMTVTRVCRLHIAISAAISDRAGKQIFWDAPGYKGRRLSDDFLVSSLDTLYTNDGTDSTSYDLSRRTESSRGMRYETGAKGVGVYRLTSSLNTSR